MMNHIVAPSILAADFGNLQKDCEMINSSEADWFHLDVMDGVFVPNISFGMPVIKSIKSYSKKTLDIHLMIIEPDKYIKTFKNIGADILTVHFEACNHLHRTIHAIKEEGMKAGVALNPHTSVYALSDILKDIDLICIMSVNPGFGGQSFIENTYKKVKMLNNLRKETESNFLIEIDGGVNTENAKELINCGADVIVAGSFVFKSNNPIQTISNLKNI
ncbi:MAG: ribulose-phosphate 3-epimerase [Bacteroidota bacterium]|nr:ribulose-phosphate 3-epimerase [Bacteroidota bacterium]